MANLFYSWQKLLSRVKLWKKVSVREEGRNDFENLAKTNFQNFGDPISRPLFNFGVEIKF
jgi:hypothetical protein